MANSPKHDALPHAGVSEEMVEAAAKAYAVATGYYVDFHRGLKSNSSDLIRKGVRAALEAALSSQHAEAAPVAAHFGDPCVYCGAPHDDVEPGPCKGGSRLWVCTCCTTEFEADTAFDPNCPFCKAWNQYTYPLAHFPGARRVFAPAPSDAGEPCQREEVALVGEVVELAGSLNDLSVIKWVSVHQPAPGTKLYASPSPSYAEPGIKALEWMEFGVPKGEAFRQVEQIWYTNPSDYCITKSRNGFFVWAAVGFWEPENQSDLARALKGNRVSINKTLDAAKAAAQADFEARIRSVLIPATSQAKGGAEARTADDCWQELVEKDDRTSPAEYPDMALITRAELADFLRSSSPVGLPSDPVSTSNEKEGGE